MLTQVDALSRHTVTITTVSNEASLELLDLLVGDQQFTETRDQPQSTSQLLEVIFIKKNAKLSNKKIRA